MHYQQLLLQEATNFNVISSFIFRECTNNRNGSWSVVGTATITTRLAASGVTGVAANKLLRWTLQMELAFINNLFCNNAYQLLAKEATKSQCNTSLSFLGMHQQ
jgi:hypothetical protein